ncbi:LysM peptidoglycan-binding domain-containing protein, partial [Staphylococcus hominis]|nr:LysM peptidoglycan-binding domain-containing protein [Staphylococcus hominis]
YGEGTVENVNKLKRANGLTSNNIVNGQKLVIPQ